MDIVPKNLRCHEPVRYEWINLCRFSRRFANLVEGDGGSASTVAATDRD